METKTIIDQLMSIEGRAKTKYGWNQQLANVRKDIWGELKTRLGAMKTAADALNTFSTWQLGGTPSGTGTWGATSGSPVLTANVSGTPTAGSYNVVVNQLAQTEISKSTGALGPATAGVRQTGAFMRSASATALNTTTLVNLRTPANGTTGLGVNSKITMNWSVNGVAQSAEYNVASGATLDNLRSWVQTTVGNGATASLVNGRIEVTTAPGTAAELDGLSFSARNSGGTTLPNFNSLAGAMSSVKTAATNGGVSSNQTITINQGGNAWNVGLTVGDTISDIANKINATSGIGVFASVVSGQLQVQSNATGATNGFTITGGGNVPALLNMQETQSAQDAQYVVDGTGYTSTKNSNVTGAIANVALNFTATTNTTLTVAQGGAPGTTPEKAMEDGIVDKVKAFITAYNSVLDYVHQKTQAESRVTSPADKSNGMTMSEYLAGPMARNVDMAGIAQKLRGALSDAVSGLPGGASMLADIGVKTKWAIGGAGQNGKLELDDAKLRAAIQADPASVQKIFGQAGASNGVSPDDGLIRRVSELAMDMTSATGTVGGAINNQTANSKRLQETIDRAQRGLDSKRKYYERMFSSMETILGKLQGQQSWLSGQIASMQNSK